MTIVRMHLIQNVMLLGLPDASSTVIMGTVPSKLSWLDPNSQVKVSKPTGQRLKLPLQIATKL